MSEKNISVAIILPTHNRAGLLPRAVRSVLEQSDPDFELIVVDDGSRDETPAVLAALAGNPSVRILVNERAVGVSAARNRAIRSTACDWIVFLDDDDELAPTYLERLRATLRKRPELGLVWTGIERRFHDRVLHSTETVTWQDHWDGRAPATHQFLTRFALSFGVAVRRERLLDAGLFDERFIGSGDIDLAMRLVARGTPYACIDAPLATVHIGEGRSISRGTGHRSGLRELLLEKNAAFLARQPLLEEHYRRFVMSGCYRDGDRRGARRQAAALLRRGRIGGRAIEVVLRYEMIEPLRRLLGRKKN